MDKIFPLKRDRQHVLSCRQIDNSVRHAFSSMISYQHRITLNSFTEPNNHIFLAEDRTFKATFSSISCFLF